MAEKTMIIREQRVGLRFSAYKKQFVEMLLETMLLETAIARRLFFTARLVINLKFGRTGTRSFGDV